MKPIEVFDKYFGNLPSNKRDIIMADLIVTMSRGEIDWDSQTIVSDVLTSILNKTYEDKPEELMGFIDSIANDNEYWSYEQDIELLGQLAFSYRKQPVIREMFKIKLAYRDAVNRLIENGLWNEMPAPEDELPDKLMPKAYFEYWKSKC